jgi:hypothetical protein
MPGTREHRRRGTSRLSRVALAFIAGLFTAPIQANANAVDLALRGHTARSQSAADTAHLHFVRESGSYLLEEGIATGGLPGKVQVRLDVGATTYASFVISTRSGSISGECSGKLHGIGTYASFGGSMTITHGSGRYSHAHGIGGFYGVLNRHSFALTVQTTGTLKY